MWYGATHMCPEIWRQVRTYSIYLHAHFYNTQILLSIIIYGILVNTGTYTNCSQTQTLFHDRCEIGHENFLCIISHLT